MDAASVVALQQTHGNTNVQRLIARPPSPAIRCANEEKAVAALADPADVADALRLSA